MVDLARVVIGRTETGRPWLLRLADRHILVAGISDAGKSSVTWAVLRALAPWIRAGLVQVFGIDPKGGMELGRAGGLFQKLACTNGAQAVELLEHIATVTRQRAETLRQQRSRTWTPGSGQPFVLLIVDELTDVIAYQPDNTLRKRANAALQSIMSQGRAPGVGVIGQLQDPRKEIIDFRHLFPTKIAMRLDEPHQVNMVLGDGVRQHGATAHEISEDTPGVAWAKIDGRVMIIPPSPDPWLPGLEPLYGEPLSVHPPYYTAPCYHQDRTERYQALLTALVHDDLELGSYDVFILGWLAEQGTAPTAAICSLLHRVRAAARREGNPHP
ncbi:MAG: FtsK/SpoIIIE domain-containing protein [Pseudonocardiaceae bacterium]